MIGTSLYVSSMRVYQFESFFPVLSKSGKYPELGPLVISRVTPSTPSRSSVGRGTGSVWVSEEGPYDTIDVGIVSGKGTPVVDERIDGTVDEGGV